MRILFSLLVSTSLVVVGAWGAHAQNDSAGSAGITAHLQHAVIEHGAASKRGVLDAATPSPLAVRITHSGEVEVYVHETFAGVVSHVSLLDLGARDFQPCPPLSVIQCWLPLGTLEAAAALPGVRMISAPSYGRTRQGSVVSQGDAILGAMAARDTFGVSGAGIRVGVISDGIVNRAQAQASGDLPATISFSSQGGGDEGTAMLEIIHDLAPNAALGFSPGMSTANFINAISWLKDTFQADIIVDDIGFFDEPFMEDGPIALAAQAAVDQGVAFFSAAGNESLEHYEAELLVASTTPPGASGAAHDFGGDNPYMEFTLTNNFWGLYLFLQWNEPLNAPVSEYRMHLYNDNTYSASPVHSSKNLMVYSGASGNQSGVVLTVFDFGFTGTKYLVVERVSGGAERFEIFGLPETRPLIMREGSVFGHPAAAGVLAVGAVDAAAPDTVQSYSQVGPAEIFVPAYELRPKPEFVATDGVSVTGAGFFPSTFYGTSAAAPHAAAIGALILQRHPYFSPALLRDAMQRGAVDIEEAGFDYYSGAGRLDAQHSLALLTLTSVRAWSLFE